MARNDLLIRFLTFVCLLLFISLNPANGQPKADQGVLDLTGWNWSEKGVVRLAGDWEFYWKELKDPDARFQPDGFVDVPALWNNIEWQGEQIGGIGHATYRLTIKVDPGEAKAIRVKTVASAFKLYVNGQELAEVGKVSDQKDQMVASYQPMVIKLDGGQSEYEVVLQAANYKHRKGGLWNDLYFGEYEQVLKGRQRQIYFDYFLIGTILIMGLYHLGLFVQRRRNWSALYFGLFCLVIMIRIFTTGEYAINTLWQAPWELLIRVEFLTFFLGGIVFFAFFRTLFLPLVHRLALRFLLVISVVCVLATITLGPYYFSQLAISYQIVLITYGLYIFGVLVKAIMQKFKGARTFMVGYVFLFLTMVQDILYVNELIETTNLFPIGVFIFLLFQSLILANRFSMALSRSERLGQELNRLNVDLEREVALRTRSLEQSNRELQEKKQQIEDQNTNLKNLNDALDRFVYSVSHDLKAPIASAMGLIHLAKREQDQHEISNYLDLQQKSLLRMEQFIGDILDYSRNTRLQVAREPIDFEGLVGESLENLSFLEGYHDIDKQVQVEQPGRFLSDQRRLSVVLNNLISNAIRYSYDNGNPKKQFIRISVKADEQGASVEIADNGVGIPDDHQERVFEMFYRADLNKSGSGLGLHIVKETLEKLSGSIRIDSKENEGTTVFFQVPNLEAMERD